MKILLYSWGANNEECFRKNLISAGHEVYVCQTPCEHYSRDMKLAQEMIFSINSKKIDAVVSFNYFPIISLVCDTTKIRYYSWVYDCPHMTLWAKTISLPCNRIGIFDRGMVEELQKNGVDTVFHLPLAVDTNHFDKQIQNTERKMFGSEKYAFDVAFVGSLYTDEHNYFDAMYGAGVPDSITAFLQRYTFNYEETPSAEAVDDKTLEDALSKMTELGLGLGEDYGYNPERLFLCSVLEKKLTIEERDLLLHKIAGMSDIKFGLYTNSKTDIPNKGTCGYLDEMPCIFRHSRINLNISLRSIHTGIPLRVMDIMGCGGFVLSNYQKEIEEFFEIDKDIVVFKSAEECMDKIGFYLKNESLREKIAQSGYEKVKKFSYDAGFERLINGETL